VVKAAPADLGHQPVAPWESLRVLQVASRQS